MYYSLGKDIIFENIRQAAAPFLQDASDLQSAYNQFLDHASIFENKRPWRDTLVANFDKLKEISPEYSKKKSAHFKQNTEFLEERINNGFFYSALDKLKVYDHSIHELTQILIKLIIVNHLETYTNGTLEDTLGLSIMDFKDEFIDQDFIELVFHQIVHMSLYLDDRNHPHMQEADKDKMIDTCLVFVNGGNAFPAYIAFHSYMVGVEMLQFREAIGELSFKGNYHGNTKRIIRVVKGFQDSLLANKNLFLDRALYILDRGEKIVSHFSEEKNIYV